MKKLLSAALALILVMLLLSGCVAEPFAPSSTAASSGGSTPAPAASPTASKTAPTSSTSAAAAAYEETTFGGYVYYFDLNPDTEDVYKLSRKNIVTNTVETLNFTASDIYSFGDNQYVNLSVIDDSLYPGGGKHWLTCKVDKEGRIREFIGGDSVIIQYDDSLYYTVYGKGCVYKSGLDCRNPETIPVTPSGSENPFETLSNTEKGQLTEITGLYSIKGGSIKAGYDIVNEKSQTLFSNCYYISLPGYKVKEAYTGKGYSNKIYKDSWLYYLNKKKPIKSSASDAPLYYIRRMKKDGSGDKNLKILCASFDFAGQYLYTNTNITYGDFGHWVSYRYNFDGKEKKKIKYSDMTRFSKGDRLYFSLFDECAFYFATTACTKVKKIEVKIPDNKKIKQKLGYNYECTFITVTGEKDGWVYFKFKVTDTGPSTYYTGNYRMNLESRKVEKVDKGKY